MALKPKEAWFSVGRWQFLLWRRWGWRPLSRVQDPPLGYIYSHLGMYGPLEVRRFH